MFFLQFSIMSFPKFVKMTKPHPFFSRFAWFCTPKQCTHIHCLVLKNIPSYMNFLQGWYPTSNTSVPHLDDFQNWLDMTSHETLYIDTFTNFCFMYLQQKTGFEELFCHCGASVLMPPIPCGTKPPECNQQCVRRHACSHPVRHTCHSEEECPPCAELTSKMCMGGHEVGDFELFRKNTGA